MTNDDSVVSTMKAAGLDGDFLPWRDVLHQGPVPAGLSPGDLRRARADFLAQSGRDWFFGALAYFTARDRALVAADDVLLWFESDLYDQLQLIQIFDLLHDGRGRRRLICIGSFPGYPGFVGLGQLTPDELATLVGTEHDLTDEEVLLGRRAWEAFRSPDPTAIEELLSGDISALPYLPYALVRHLEEFPSAEDGLSRTERAILELTAGGTRTWTRLFGEAAEREERPYLDDLTFREHLVRLLTAPHPLLAARDGAFLELTMRLRAGRAANQEMWPAAAADELTPTAEGEAVLAGEADAVELNGVDRWYGGVHLEGSEPAWRWNRHDRRLVAQ